MPALSSFNRTETPRYRLPRRCGLTEYPAIPGAFLSNVVRGGQIEKKKKRLYFLLLPTDSLFLNT